MSRVAEPDVDALAREAWAAREHAHVLGQTKVGCAVLATDGRTFVGCNVEHRFRSHDIHAEVNAIGSLVAAGAAGMTAIFIAASRERFTPCGSCLDWIFEIGGPECVVYCQEDEASAPKKYLAAELMPYYPR